MTNNSNNFKSNHLLPSVSGISGVNPPTNGIWLIDSNTTITGENLVINGSIEVQYGYNLTIKNSVLSFSSNLSTITVNNGSLHIVESEISNFSSIRLLNKTDCIIEDNFFSNFATAVRGTDSQIVIARCTFDRGNTSVFLDETKNASIKDNILTNILISAIGLSKSNDILVENNTMTGEGNTYECVGVNIGDSDNIICRKNRIYNFHKTVYWKNVLNSTFMLNEAAQLPSSLMDDGEVQFVDSLNILIKNNTITNLTYDGFEVYRSENVQIIGNTIIDCNAGLHLEHSPLNNVLVEYNIITNSSIISTNVNGFIIRYNIFNNGHISAMSCTDVEIYNNSICENRIQMDFSTGISENNTGINCDADTQDSTDNTSYDNTDNSNESDISEDTTNSQAIDAFSPSIMLIMVIGSIIIIGKQNQKKINNKIYQKI